MTTLLILVALALIWIGLRDSRQPRIASFPDPPQGSAAPRERLATE